MNKTVYLRDEEGPIWERARELAGDKLSPVIVAALKRFVAAKEAEEAEAKGFERIQVSFRDSEDHGIPKVKAFHGKWIFTPDDPLRAFDEEREIATTFMVALTAKGSVVVHYWKEDQESRWDRRFSVYPSLEAAAADERVNYAITSAIEKLGVRVEELDI